MKIDYLSHHLSLIPLLAEWNYSEWGKGWDSLEVVVEKYSEMTNTTHIPITWVALDDQNDLLGFVSLIESDMEIRSELTPWLAGLYVLPQYRKQGMASSLIKKVIIDAKRLRINEVFLYTGNDSRVHLYERLGWKPFDTVQYKGETAVIMKRTMD